MQLEIKHINYTPYIIVNKIDKKRIGDTTPTNVSHNKEKLRKQMKNKILYQ